jgi:hypothetical protein
MATTTTTKDGRGGRKEQRDTKRSLEEFLRAIARLHDKHETTTKIVVDPRT